MLSEWWTYRPHDFLMFAPHTYWRLFELHNAAWPLLQWLLPAAALLGVCALAWCARPGAGRAQERAAQRLLLPGLLAALAAVWAFVALAFLGQRYVPINWAAQGLVGLWLLQSGLLALLAVLVLRRAWTGAPAQWAQRAFGHAPAQTLRRGGTALLAALALLIYPLLPLASGRSMLQAEWFGLAPDPTALLTLAVLLSPPGAHAALREARALAWVRTACIVLSALSLMASAVVLLVMGTLEGGLLAGVLAALAVGAAISRLRRGGLGR